MKLTAKLKAGRKAEWAVRSGRKVVAEINRQLVGGVKMGFVPYLKLGKPSDGSAYSWRVLRHAETLDEAVEAVRLAVASKVTDRVTFIGVCMTVDRAAKFANAMAEEPRP